MEIAFWLAIIFGFYTAWSIGANDAANAMGTSVGSKAITFKEAVIIAAIFEFSGAVLAGGGVADTMRKGIVDPEVFASLALFPAGNGAEYFVWGMMASLIAAALWMHIAAYLGWPVSTTHSIVGAITGFGVVAVGASNINWLTLLKISASWITSPLIGGLLAFTIFTLIRKFIIDARDVGKALRIWSPFLSFPVFTVLSLMLFVKGFKNVEDQLAEYGIGLVETFAISGLVGVLASFVVYFLLRNLSVPLDAAIEERHREIERVFRFLQIITACFVAFAHGSNDVANSVGPLAAIVNTVEAGEIMTKVPVPTWVLLLGAVGIVIGLATYGYRVIETIGTKITEITPSRGFAAEFGAASTILVGSTLGIPLSTTHTVVGAVIGVGFARGINALDLRIIWNILKSWLYTIPFTAVLTMILYYLLSAIFV